MRVYTSYIKSAILNGRFTAESYYFKKFPHIQKHKTEKNEYLQDLSQVQLLRMGNRRVGRQSCDNFFLHVLTTRR